ncbi:MAG: hypothetical protein MHM6MM_004712 [Cercozoa sp. M6MM]
MTLDVLSLVQRSRYENGLRNDDFGRYRKYCTSRLRKLRKKLGLQHRPDGGDSGNKDKKFQKKELTQTDIQAGVTVLQLPLLEAERAWAHAMNLKAECKSLREHHRVIARLGKSARYATQLLDLCQHVDCPGKVRIRAEVAAYTSATHATLALEKERHADALKHLTTAIALYDGLAEVCDGEIEVISREQSQRLSRLSQYCAYMCRTQPVSETADDVASNIDSETLLVALKSERQSEGDIETETADTLLFRGTRVPVHLPHVVTLWHKARACLTAAQQKSEETEQLAHDVKSWRADVAALVDKAREHVDDAVLRVRQKLTATEGADKQDVYAKAQRASWRTVLSALHWLRLCARRQALEARITLETTQYLQQQELLRRSLDSLEKSGIVAPKKPMSALAVASLCQQFVQCSTLCARLQDAAIPLHDDQSHVVDESLLPEEREALEAELAKRRAAMSPMSQEESQALACVKSLRAFLLAEHQRQQEQYESAFRLYSGSRLHALEGASPLVIVASKARVLLAALAKHVYNMQHTDHTDTVLGHDTERPLMQRLDDYDAGRADLSHKLAQFPPAPQPMGCKPILLDLAYEYVQYPHVKTQSDEEPAVVEEQGAPKQEKRGWLGKWF